MRKPKAGQNDFHEGFSRWLYSEEGWTSLEATDVVFKALEATDLDVDLRMTFWPGGDMLKINQTAQRIHKQTGTDIESIKTHILGWMQTGFEPETISEKQMEIFEEKIGAWIDDFKAANLKY
jgi:hypothetical protein